MAAQQAVAVCLQKLTETLPMVGMASDLGKAIHEAIGKLSKAVQPGSVSPAGKRNEISNMAMKAEQNQQTQQQLGKMGQPSAGGPPGGGQGGMPMPGMAA